MMRKSLSAAIAVSAVMLGATAVAAPTLTMTAPEEGAIYSAGATGFQARGEVTFDEPEPATTRFYLRRDTCSPLAGGARWLSPTTGAEPPCTPVFDPLGNIVLEGFGNDSLVRQKDYTQREGGHQTLDASRPITGVLTVSSYSAGPAHAGVGMTTIEISVQGNLVSGAQYQTIGTTSVTFQTLPGEGPKAIPWTVTPASGLDGRDFAVLNFHLAIRGTNAFHGYVMEGGASHFDLPVWTASFDRRVQVAIDGGDWTSQGTTLSADLHQWTATIPMPLPGSHTLQVRAIQGFDSPGCCSDVLDRSFEVVD